MAAPFPLTLVSLGQHTLILLVQAEGSFFFRSHFLRTIHFTYAPKNHKRSTKISMILVRCNTLWDFHKRSLFFKMALGYAPQNKPACLYLNWNYRWENVTSVTWTWQSALYSDTRRLYTNWILESRFSVQNVKSYFKARTDLSCTSKKPRTEYTWLYNVFLCRMQLQVKFKGVPELSQKEDAHSKTRPMDVHGRSV